MRESKRTSLFLSACCALLFLWETGRSALGQSNLVYDQQSATNGLATGGTRIQANQPFGQTFTPVSAFVGFAQLQFLDSIQNNGIGSTVFVNLRENSITGNVLASSSPVFMPNIFWGTALFYFESNVPVTPGRPYFLEPVLLSGDDTYGLSDFYNYLGGDMYFSGQPSPNGKDLWFREGYVVPELSAFWLGLVGGIAAVWLKRGRLLSR